MRYFIFIIAIFLALSVVGRGDYTDAVASQAHHCKMVDLWQATYGEAGHPNYDGRQC